MAGKKSKKRRRTQQKFRKPPDKCPFCEKRTRPMYKEYKILRGYLSDRAKILGTDRTGVCARHQRRLSIEVKRARHLGLLPFTPGI